jgi:hypothetical protein
VKFRKLRIAWSVFWGLACVLLIVLWVRSYYRGDYLIMPATDTRGFGGNSLNGWLKLSTFSVGKDDPWRWVREPKRKAMVTYGTFFEAKQNRFGFGWHQIKSTYAVMMPHWFPLLLAAMVAAIPWVSWRFTLRTLLIATTLVAVVLGVVVYVTR